MVATKEAEVLYQVDAQDRLILCNQAWDAFADENHSPHLHGSKILGLSLWDFIHDWDTRHIHEIILARVRNGSAVTNLPFRCDSPGLRRFMEMDIVLRTKGTIEYRCRLLRLEEREALPLFEEDAEDNRPFVRLCSWCKKVAVGRNWLEIEEAVAALDLLGQETLPPISHSMCDTCLADLENNG